MQVKAGIIKEKYFLNTRYMLVVSFVSVILATTGSSCCEISLSDYKKTEKCVADMNCTNYVDENIMDELINWEFCGSYELECDSDNPFHRMEQLCDKKVFIHDVTLQVTINGVNRFWLSGLKVIYNYIIDITISQSIYIPYELYELKNVRNIQIINNPINSVNLYNFLKFDELICFNGSHNSISELQTNLTANTEKKRPSQVSTIDLSYNSIQTLPNEYFSRFSQLQNLNLSHNFITNIDILTFEGITYLRTLQLSHNKLLQVGQTLTRFSSLVELSLDNNRLTSVTDLNFRAMNQLVKLHLNSNELKYIEDNSLHNLVRQEELDLRNNKITVIRKAVFEKNSNLHSLRLANNNIESIETGTFEGKNISSFNIENNCLSGLLEEGTFEGIYSSNLDLSSGLLTALASDVFRTSHITSLNLSLNSIDQISKSAFHSVVSLKYLYLSYNNLDSINFNTKDLTELLVFHAKNNSVERISRNTFRYLVKLTELDLSNNAISELESESFKDLENLELLKLSSNGFNASINAKTFTGLFALTRLYLEHAKIRSIDTESFSGLSSLKYLNISHNNLNHISYNAFKNTGSLEIIDLSHNSLEVFSVDKTDIPFLNEFILNNNKLQNVSDEIFSSLLHLRKLNLANNNIVKMEFQMLLSLVNLRRLDLSLNVDLEISKNVFENLPAFTMVSLKKTKTSFNFEHAINTSIQILDMSLCNFENLNSLFIYNVKDLIELNLSSNKFTSVDKYSFLDIPTLSMLDLSFNSINFIQPGSFLHTNNITSLNLHGNEITSLQFGVLDGLNGLQTLNLSNNLLRSFDANLLHNIPRISVISLDNNVIENFDFQDFTPTVYNKITIGGNPISCHVFSDVKGNLKYFSFKVTAENLDYHSENFNGVTCRSDPKNKQSSSWHLLNSTDLNATYAFIELSNAIGRLQNSIDNLSSKGNVNDSGIFKRNVTDLLQLIDEHIVKSQIDSSTGNKLLVDYFTNRSTILVPKDSDGNQLKLTNKQLEEHINFLNEEDKIVEELKALFQNMKNSNKDVKVTEGQSADQSAIVALLCIVVVCLVTVSAIFLGKHVYNFLKTRKIIDRYNHSSTQHIPNVIELE